MCPKKRWSRTLLSPAKKTRSNTLVTKLVDPKLVWNIAAVVRWISYRWILASTRTERMGAMQGTDSHMSKMKMFSRAPMSWSRNVRHRKRKPHKFACSGNEASVLVQPSPSMIYSSKRRRTNSCIPSLAQSTPTPAVGQQVPSSCESSRNRHKSGLIKWNKQTPQIWSNVTSKSLQSATPNTWLWPRHSKGGNLEHSQ
jgi:hypothetical protein